MHGHIEPLTGLLRVGGAYGQAWTWVVTLRYLSPTSVEVLGAQRAPLPSEWKSAVRTMRLAGIERFYFERRKSERKRRSDWKV